MNKQKNGKIELLRFIFCMTVILFHISEDLSEYNLMLGEHITFWGRGYIAVEFFFLTTGYLTAASIFRNRNDGVSLGESTWRFMYKKILSLLPYHLVVITLGYLYRVVLRHQPALITLIKALPNIFFLQMTGLHGKNLVSVEWYIASMLMALCILYPLCRRYYDVFVRIVAPMLGFSIVGFLIHEVGVLGKPKTFLGFTYAGNIRAVGMICLGMFSFELIRMLEQSEACQRKRWLFTIGEAAGYLLVTYFIFTDKLSDAYSGTFALLLCLLVGISFSDLPYGQKYFNNKFCYFLGKCSLPIYLSQNLIRSFAVVYGGGLRLRYRILLTVTTTVILGIVTMLAVEKIRNRRSLQPKHENSRDHDETQK